MKKFLEIAQWVLFGLFALMALVALSEGGLLGAFLFLVGAALVIPWPPIRSFRSKLKIKPALSATLAVVVFLFGSIVMGQKLETDKKTPVESPASESTLSTAEKAKDATTDESVIAEAPSGEKTPQTAESAAPTPHETTPPKAVGSGQNEPVAISAIPAYSGAPYVVLNHNVPNFSSDELKTVGYETYSDLDALGRCGAALASVGKETMPAPGETRGSISSIKPTGWVEVKYDNVSGKWLYNRCHLIGWQLSSENANRKNLITGTRYLNTEGMLPFENMVADYIKETSNHVAYRVSPIYNGGDLLASGVVMEAYSVEDGGEGIQFHVYCYNVQPGVTIDYATGNSAASGSTAPTPSTPPVTTTTPPPTTTPPTTTPPPTTTTTPPPVPTQGKLVYRAPTGKRYHYDPDCAGSNHYQVTLEEAISQGLTPCKKCAGG